MDWAVHTQNCSVRNVPSALPTLSTADTGQEGHEVPRYPGKANGGAHQGESLRIVIARKGLLGRLSVDSIQPSIWQGNGSFPS